MGEVGQVKLPQLGFATKDLYLISNSSYKLVSYTENILEFNIAMGAPKQWLWLTKYMDDRLSVKNVGPGGLARMTWKITWKFCECSKYLVKKCIALRDFQLISTSATRSSG